MKPDHTREPVEILLASSEESAISPEIIEQRSENPSQSDRVLFHSSTATLTVTWPREGKSSVPAVLICPGGGYAKLVIDKEGHAMARWLNDHGYVAAVLKYRLPRPDISRGETPWPVQDATKAMKSLRQRADEWGIDKQAIGIMGSSAGGHLASVIATHFDEESSRPDFQILLYPVISMSDELLLHERSRTNLLGNPHDPERVIFYSSEKQVTAETPPAFLIHAADDGVAKVGNSRTFHAALLNTGVPSEFVELPTGGHGFGLGVNGGDPLRWPPLCISWLEKICRR